MTAFVPPIWLKKLYEIQPDSARYNLINVLVNVLVNL